MPPRRAQRYDWDLALGVRYIARWETERDAVTFAVVLLAEIAGNWQTVVLFDCTHGDRNDRHRYSFNGVKGPAETFHWGTPGEAMRDAIHLIRAGYARMIEQWRR
ncbi:MAG TPA: hypothetical protein VKB25_09405 [Conexibacter sp.]|nr:hypothetical protein [Conexibacter sp.]